MYWRNLLSKKQISDRAKDYYENDKKKRLREQARNKYLNLSGEEEKKREYGRNRYRNMFKEEKQKLK